ncbi:hypothetical protein pb186bvf_020919 [Paramecium bursaria]
MKNQQRLKRTHNQTHAIIRFSLKQDPYPLRVLVSIITFYEIKYLFLNIQILGKSNNFKVIINNTFSNKIILYQRYFEFIGLEINIKQQNKYIAMILFPIQIYLTKSKIWQLYNIILNYVSNTSKISQIIIQNFLRVPKKRFDKVLKKLLKNIKFERKNLLMLRFITFKAENFQKIQKIQSLTKTFLLDITKINKKNLKRHLSIFTAYMFCKLLLKATT